MKNGPLPEYGQQGVAPPEYAPPEYAPPALAPPEYAPPAPAPPTVIPILVTARTSVYGPNPVEMDCPHCQMHVVTHVERVAGALPWVIFGMCLVLGFFLFGIPWCFCCVPFCVDSCLDVVHGCPSCRNILGRYNRM